LEIPAVAACSAPKKPLSGLDRETPSPGSRERGKKALSERGGISSVPQMEKGTTGTRGWRANGKKRGPSSLKRGGPGTGSAKGFRIRAGMTRAAVRRAAETIRRRTRRKAEIWKGGFFPIRAAAIVRGEGLNLRIPVIQPEFSLPV